jgi:diaminopimelate decarboxylase
MIGPAIDRIELFPITSYIRGVDRAWLEIGGHKLSDLAEEHGTPLYLYDRATLETALGEYRLALQDSYPGESGITYAGKAYLSLAMAQWVRQHHLLLDCTGIGELGIATAAGLPRQTILVHGVNKSTEDLNAAIELAGIIVVDNLLELERLNLRLSQLPINPPNIWLRARPGIAVDTHTYTQTGQEDSKFGMGTDEIIQAVKYCLDNQLPVSGLHFHQGSHFHDVAPLRPAIETMLVLIADLKDRYYWQPDVLCTGGGWGVAYHEDELPHPDIRAYIRSIGENVLMGCQSRGLRLPKLQIEPGRSLVARAGVAIYRVGAIKKTANRQYLLLDGGMADNIRPALYGARYSALPIIGIEREFTTQSWLAGPYCESSDILIHDLSLPDIQPSEYIAIPVSGAYHLSMSSNYNGARRPAVIWIEDGRTHLIQRREKIEELYQRDIPLE